MNEVYPWVPDRKILNTVASSPIQEVLGCAAWGCAFKLKNGHVLKVTTDDDEIAAVNLFLDLRTKGDTLRGVVDFFRAPMIIRKFPRKERLRSKIYVYEREAVTPISYDENAPLTFNLPIIFRSYMDYPSMTAFSFASNAAMRLINIISTKQPSRERYKRERELINDYKEGIEHLRRASNTDPDISYVITLLDTLLAHGEILADFGENNLGIGSDGIVKLFDFELVPDI